ncbi:MAG: PEP-CTERM sorting domain-containing protein [Phycisphaerae bacterium]
MAHRGIRVCVASVLLLVVGQAQASVILRLSDFSSNNVPAEQLDAERKFSVSASTLTLRVTNLTPGAPSDPPLKINEIYFNATDNVTGLILTSSSPQWQVDFAEDGFLVDAFGLFDVQFTDGAGHQPQVVDPGETVVFTFDIIGTGPFSETDFVTELSTVFDQHIPSLAAAKFFDDGGVSAFGNVIPEPAGLILLLLGGAVVARRRAR